MGANEFEVEQSSPDKAEPLSNDLTGEKLTEDKEEVDEETQGGKGKEEGDDDDPEEKTEVEHESDMSEKKLQQNSVDLSNDGLKELHVEVLPGSNADETKNYPVDAVENSRDTQTGSAVSSIHGSDSLVPDASLKSGMAGDPKSLENDEKGPTPENTEESSGVKMDICDSLSRETVDHETFCGAAPNQSSPLKAEHREEEELRNEANIDEGPADFESQDRSSCFVFDTDTSGGGESGTKGEQEAFVNELVKFHKERSLDFKPPKFYGEPLNLLKLWRSVLKLGGYDKVTACKYWRQVGESFKPPKTCTTISWTFRIFYEKALLDYERYRASTDGSGFAASLSVSEGADDQTPGSGRARRDAAARAMQGWHSQRALDNGEVSDPIIKDKNSLSASKKEKPLKSLGGILNRKRPSSTDAAVTIAQTKVPRTQSDATVIDIGSPADWVKINVRATRDCYEVYALVPGLLREEVRVQSDPAGRLVISGEPENPDNPWNVTPFKKVVSLPSRIDPHQTSAVVTLHGQLFVRVPFEQYE